MSADRIEELLREAADDVEPGDRLEAILQVVGEARRRRQRWVAGSAVLVAASVVTTLVLVTGIPGPGLPDPAGTSTPPPTTSPSTSPTTPTSLPEPSSTVPVVVAVYYVGDTPSGPRLYRELRPVSGEPLAGAVSAAVGRDGDGRPLYPLDPDYRVAWPSFVRSTVEVSPEGDVIDVDLSGDPERDLHGRGEMSSAAAQLAVEAVVRTAQEAAGEDLPVRFRLFGQVTDQVLGVPASEPLDAGSDLSVLSRVSLTDPTQGLLVDNDDPFVVRGLGNSYEGTVVVRIQRWEGTFIVDEEATVAGWQADRLFPFDVTFDLGDVPPGDYEVVARTDDPSGHGDVDTRVISITD